MRLIGAVTMGLPASDQDPRRPSPSPSPRSSGGAGRAPMYRPLVQVATAVPYVAQPTSRGNAVGASLSAGRSPVSVVQPSGVVVGPSQTLPAYSPGPSKVNTMTPIAASPVGSASASFDGGGGSGSPGGAYAPKGSGRAPASPSSEPLTQASAPDAPSAHAVTPVLVYVGAGVLALAAGAGLYMATR